VLTDFVVSVISLRSCLKVQTPPLRFVVVKQVARQAVQHLDNANLSTCCRLVAGFRLFVDLWRATCCGSVADFRFVVNLLYDKANQTQFASQSRQSTDQWTCYVHTPTTWLQKILPGHHRLTCIPRRAVLASLRHRRSPAPAVSSPRPAGRPASRAVDIWKTFIQLRRPFRLERSSRLSEEQYSFSVCLQKPA